MNEENITYKVLRHVELLGSATTVPKVFYNIAVNNKDYYSVLRLQKYGNEFSKGTFIAELVFD